MKTYFPKGSELVKNWILLDAKGKKLGRVASQAASILQGKHKTNFVRHMDCGDGVVIVNASLLDISINKAKKIYYYRHSGYPGGLKKISVEELYIKSPDKLLRKVIEGMLPKNRLGKKMIKKLRVYPLEKHEQVAQKPVLIEEASKIG